MNRNKLKEAETVFLQRYPGGFSHPEMQELAKKHKTTPLIELARTSFARENFSRSATIVETMAKIISRSSLISLFEKPKFRDFAASLSTKERSLLAEGLFEFLHGSQKQGFDILVEILKKEKLAKWPLVSACPFYYHPTKEVFIKPTTAKNVIPYFEIEGMTYKPAPTYEFYKSYRTILNKMKKEVDPSLSPDNAHFSGFLMMVMDGKL